MSENITLGDVLTNIEAGKSFLTSEILARPDELGVLKVSALSWSAFLPGEAKALHGDYTPAESHKVKKDDLLISRANTRELVGAIVLVEHDYPTRLLSDKTLRLVVDENRVSKDYLLFALRSAQARQHIEQYATGTSDSMRNISQEVIKAIPVWLPPLSEQRQIAARLKAQLAEVETARQAAQAQMRDVGLLCTKIVDAAFDGFAEWRPIEEVAKVQSGYAFKSESFKTSGVRLLRNTNILPGKIYWDDAVYLDENEAGRYPAYLLEDGDVLISLDRPVISSGIKVARVGEADLPSLLLQRVGRFLLKPETIDADFLYAFLKSSRFIDAISGHDQSLGVPHISPGQVESVEMPWLSLDEQRRIVAHLKAQLAEADALRAALAIQQRELDALPQRILAQAFQDMKDAP